jgi:hypothetical protein
MVNAITRNEMAEAIAGVHARGAEAMAEGIAAFESPTFPVSVVILASPNTLGHSPKARLVVTMMEARS